MEYKELIKVWNEYKTFLQKKYPVKENQEWKFTCPYHQRIDTILKLQQKELIVDLFEMENRVPEFEGYYENEEKWDEALKSFSDNFNPKSMDEDLMKLSNDVVDELLFGENSQSRNF